MARFGNIAFTPSVKAEQERMGSRRAYARASEGDAPDSLGEDEIAFLAERDSFYMASVGETGWPYVQHRGGPKGFVRVLDAHTLGFADYRGNRQYISLGNVARDDRVALMFMDYPGRTRLKVLAHARVITPEKDFEDLARLVSGSDSARVERGFILHVEGFDWNCPQHITRRFTEREVGAMMNPLLQRIELLEAENRDLRAGSSR